MNAPSKANSPPDFLVHDAGDDVGVVVVEGVAAGQTLTGWSMEDDKTLTLQTRDPIPLGHKVALKAKTRGDDVLKYGEVIGALGADIVPGAHVHTHNLKTKKW